MTERQGTQRRLELLAKTALNEFDLSICEIDELATIYDAMTVVEFSWVGVMNRPRIGDDAGPELCEQEAGRAFEMMKIVVRELRDRKPGEDEVDNRKRVLADWTWRTEGQHRDNGGAIMREEVRRERDRLRARANR